MSFAVLGAMVTTSNCVPGLVVKRGSDWRWKNQDYSSITGQPTTGTVMKCYGDKWAEVKWKDGNTHDYRVGTENANDLIIVSGRFLFYIDVDDFCYKR